MSLIHLARQGFITKSALPNVTRQRGTTTGTANLMLYGAGKTHSIGTNTTFTDSSTNNFTVTRNGDTIQATNNPFTGSVYFDGNGDYLTLAPGAAFQFGTGDFTVEMFVNFSNASNAYAFFVDARNSSQTTAWCLFRGNTGNLTWNTGSAELAATFTTTNTWQHIAYTRASNTGRLFINGVLAASWTDSTNYSVSPTTSYIGSRYSISEFTNGYITNLRVVKGTAVYTSAFTPPTSPLTAITNTQLLLLTAQQAPFRDSSTNNFTVTANGNAAGSGLEPFPVNYAGSAYFDGNGDYLSLASNAAFDFGTGDFTVEAWIYIAGNSPLDAQNRRIANVFFIGSSITTNFLFYIDGDSSTTGTKVSFYDGSSSLPGTSSLAQNRWHHIALTRSGTTLRIFLNGVVEGTNTSFSSSQGSSTNSVYIGRSIQTGYTFDLNGYISNLRVIKGTAQYTAAFTPPAAPLTAVTNTQLLLLTNNIGPFVDTSANGFPVLRNGDAVQTGFSPFTSQPSAGSGYFDGTGDYLTIPNFSALQLTNSTAFTIECWAYPTNLSGTEKFIIENYNQSSPFQGYGIRYSVSNSILEWWEGGASWVNTGITLTLNEWTHIAVTYEGSGTTKRFFKNGVLSGSAGTVPSGINYTAGACSIGAQEAGSNPWLGYISNLRVIKGTALYTSNFTPATAPLPAVTNTSLLLNTDNYTIANSTPTYLPVTVNGNTTISTAQYPTGMNRSIYFDGANSTFLRVATNSIFTFSADFTLEFWFYGASQAKLLVWAPNFTIENNAGGVLKVWTASTDDIVLTAYPANQWNHFALARTGSACKAFLNGTQVGSFTNSSTTNFDFSNGTIGNRGDGLTNWGWNGYISNFRTIKGSGLYSGNFTPEALPMSLSVTVPAYVTNNIYGVYQLA